MLKLELCHIHVIYLNILKYKSNVYTENGQIIYEDRVGKWRLDTEVRDDICWGLIEWRSNNET